MWHAQLQGQGVCVLFFFKVVWTFLLLLTGFSLHVGVFFLRCNRVVSICHCCFGLFHLVVDSWSEEIFANCASSSGETWN
jgi:hypothetical protein